MNDFMMYDVTALLIFVTLIVSNFSKNKIKGRTNWLYTVELIVCVVTLIFRLTYQLILRNCTYSQGVVLIAKIFIYLALTAHSLIYPVGMYFVFSSLGIYPLVNRNVALRISMILLSLIPLIYILMDTISNTIFVINTQMQIKYLAPVWILNICILLLVLFGFILSLYYGRVLERIHIIYCSFLFPFNMVLFFIQCMRPQAQVEMFVIAITCYLVFATIQRPELLINPESLAQSSIAFENELKKVMNINVAVKIIFIKLSNSKSISMYLGSDRFSALLKKITLFLRNLCKNEKLGATVFYLNDNIYALPTEYQTDEMIDDVLNKLERYFSQIFVMDGIKINLETRMLVIRTPEDITNYEFLSYISKAFYTIVEPNGKPQWYRDYSGDKNFIIKNNIDKILHRAIENKSFEVYYQPIFNVSKQRFCSAEALVRLRDPEFGFIPPAMFINHAELTNQIHIIGDFVLEKVCEFIGSKQGKSLGIDYIEINLSPSQCVETDLVAKIAGWLEKNKVKPEQIRLEITESAASFNTQIVEKNIYALKQMGINFALDDYGIGYSDIKKVISLPFDVVKLNKSFVEEIDNPHTVSIVEDTIRMLRLLGKEILVEGIETEDRAKQFAKLKYEKKNSCEYLQGFYFSHPLPQSEFVKFLTI